MVKNKALPDSAAPPVWLLSLSLSFSLCFSLSPSQTWPYQGWSQGWSLSHRCRSTRGYPLDPAGAGPRHHTTSDPNTSAGSIELAVWAQSLCSLVLTTHLILQTGRCPSVPRKCQPHAHLGDTAGGDLFPAGVSLPPSTFQPGKEATQPCACSTTSTPGVNITQLSTK